MFTMTSAMQIQARDIKKLERLLLPKVLNMVKAEAMRRNLELFQKENPSPYDVWRGVDINGFLSSLFD